MVIFKSQVPKPSELEELRESEDEEIDSSSEEDEEVKCELAGELADVTFGDLQKARSNGTLFVHHEQKEKKTEKKTGRANKNRPMEVSCKKPVSRYREVVQGPKKVTRDPRFESLSGDLDTERFRKRYNFLFEEEFPAEREELRKKLKKTHDPEAVEEIKSQLSFFDKQLNLNSNSSKRKENSILAEHKRKEREAAKKGKKPFYLKKSEVKKLRNIEKFNELKASGPKKLNAYMDMKRRKNASKDQRHMPNRRPNADKE